MINLEMAADYLRRSLSCLREAEEAFKRKDYSLCIRRSQESIEMAAKSLLRSLSIEYPRAHDVSDVLLLCRDRIPLQLSDRLDEIASLVSELAAIRGPAMYGYEREGIPASRAFSLEYAREILERVRAAVNEIASSLIPMLEERGFWSASPA